MKEEAQ